VFVFYFRWKQNCGLPPSKIEQPPHFIGALKDDDQIVRQRAAESVGKLKLKEAVPALIESLKLDSELRRTPRSQL